MRTEGVHSAHSQQDFSSSSSYGDDAPDDGAAFDEASFNAVKRDSSSWAGAQPAKQGLYDPVNEHDSCGVGFVCQIKGKPSHKLVSDARQLLCAMTHRGATGADARDGDGAGVMTGIPHDFFKREAEREIGATLPEPGQYAVGNVFFNPVDYAKLEEQKATFAKIAVELGLRVLGWRAVPVDNTILGPASKSREPAILQPFVVLHSHYGDGPKPSSNPFDSKRLERQLYVLRKHATHTMFVDFNMTLRLDCMLKCLCSPSRVCKVVLPNGSTSVPCPRRTSCTRASSRPRKCTTTTTTSITSCMRRTLPSSTPVSRPIRSRAGTEPSP